MPTNHLMLSRIAATPKCSVCGGCGASLTQDCPGLFMTDAQAQDVGLGTLDYRYGCWSQVANSEYGYRLWSNELQGLDPDSERASDIKKILDQSDYFIDPRLGCMPKRSLVI